MDIRAVLHVQSFEINIFKECILFCVMLYINYRINSRQTQQFTK
jgi:hypothetical protein